MKKINDLVYPGEVLIVQRPHRFPTKVYGYMNIEETFNAFFADSNVYHMSPLKDQDLEKEFEYLRDNDYAEETVEEKIQKVKDELAQAGISEDEPYIIWETGSEIYYPDTEKGRLDLLKELVDDDMHSGRVFIAEKNQTYKEFLDDVYHWTRGHNEPSYQKLVLGCDIDDDFSFNLDKIVQIAEYNDFDVECARESDPEFSLKDYIFNWCEVDCAREGDSNSKITCLFRSLNHPDSPAVEVTYNPYRPKDFMSSFETAAVQNGNQHLQELAQELKQSLKESFATNYTKEYVGLELVQEAKYLKAINPVATPLEIVAKAQENILLYEEDVRREDYPYETKKELLQQFFKEMDIVSEKKLASFITQNIRPKEISRTKTDGMERGL